MKPLLTDFNKAFESKVRLGIMSILMVNDTVDFNTLKELLMLSDGNLASHIKSLEELKYINVNKQFVGKSQTQPIRPRKRGVKLFVNHLKALENLIKGQLK